MTSAAILYYLSYVYRPHLTYGPSTRPYVVVTKFEHWILRGARPNVGSNTLTKAKLYTNHVVLKEFVDPAPMNHRERYKPLNPCTWAYQSVMIMHSQALITATTVGLVEVIRCTSVP
jgi:hypothetical protein